MPTVRHSSHWAFKSLADCLSLSKPLFKKCHILGSLSWQWWSNGKKIASITTHIPPITIDVSNIWFRESGCDHRQDLWRSARMSKWDTYLDSFSAIYLQLCHHRLLEDYPSSILLRCDFNNQQCSCVRTTGLFGSCSDHSFYVQC